MHEKFVNQLMDSLQVSDDRNFLLSLYRHIGATALQDVFSLHMMEGAGKHTLE